MRWSFEHPKNVYENSNKFAFIFLKSYLALYLVMEFPYIMPNKEISVFRVMDLQILGRVGTHIFFIFFFWKKNTMLCILKGKLAFQNA